MKHRGCTSRMAATLRMMAVAVVVACLTAVSQGCAEPERPEPSPVPPSLAPVPPAPPAVPVAGSKSLFLKADLTGVLWWTDPGVSMLLRQEQTLSPGGSSLLLTLQEPATSGSGAVSIAAYSFTDQWQDPAVFFNAGPDWVEDYSLAMPLGWVTDRSCLFLVGYEQVDGPHAGSRGISIRQGDLVTGRAVETGFIESDYGILFSAAFMEEQGKAYLHVSGASGSIWEYDVKTQSLRIVRDDLPENSSLFQPELSSQGTWFVAGGGEPDKSGVYLIDAATGEETWLLQAGDTFSFYPLWSPDGKWVSALTASRKPDATGSGIGAYDAYPAEDGPAAVATKLTVTNVVDSTTRVTEAGGELISWPTWSIDSKKVYFLASKPGRVGIHGPEVSWDSLYSLDVATGEVGEIADLRVLSSQVQGTVRYVNLVGGTQHGVVFNLCSTDSQWSFHSVWYAEDGNPLRKIADGEWQVPFGVAACGDRLVGFVRDVRLGGGYSLWALGPDGPEEIASDILQMACPGENFTTLELLTWDSDRVFAVAYSYTNKTGKSSVLGFRVR